MRCSTARKNLSPYIDGELRSQESALLESHLAQCGRCAGELDEIKRLRSLFSQAERLTAPSGFRAGVMARVGQPAKGLSFIPVFTRFAEAIAVVLAITTGGLMGGMLINALAPNHKGAQVIASLSLDAFEALPPDSLGRAYLAMTEERR